MFQPQDNKGEIVSKKLSILKEKENNLTELQDKYDNLLTKVQEMTSILLEKERKEVLSLNVTNVNSLH